MFSLLIRTAEAIMLIAVIIVLITLTVMGATIGPELFQTFDVLAGYSYDKRALIGGILGLLCGIVLSAIVLGYILVVFDIRRQLIQIKAILNDRHGHNLSVTSAASELTKREPRLTSAPVSSEASDI